MFAARVRAAAEQAKIDLSARETAEVVLPFIAQKAGAPISFEHEVTRADWCAHATHPAYF